MRINQVLLAAALSFACVGLANAKSYQITLSEPTMAGTTVLPAGQYQVTVEGTNAVMVNRNLDKSYTTPVNVESQTQKFGETAVLTHSDKGQSRIEAIELGGSRTELQFK